MDLNFFKVNGPSSHMIMMVSLFATLSTSSIIISPVNNENENIAFAQTTSTANGNNNTNMNNSLNGNTSITNKQSQSFQISYFSNFTRSMGSISSIQNNESGKPAWVLNGQWNLVIPKPLKINQTNPPNAALFSAGFEMIKTNGKLMHTHTIADFKLKRSAVNGNVLVLTGTATVSMKDGPVKDVPISISIINQGVLKLWIDPSKTNNHFGNTPLYGTVSSEGIFLTFP